MDSNQQISHSADTGKQLIQDTEARFFLASVVNSLQDSIVIINPDAIITSWNKGAELVYGCPASEAIGKSLNLVASPDDFKKLFESINRILAGKQIESRDSFHLHKQEQEQHIEVTSTLVRNDRGAVIGISMVGRDVTELRTTQEVLRTSESRLRGILEAAVDFGIVVLDIEGKIIDWNQGAENMFGYEKAEILGQSGDIIFTDEDRDAGIPQKEMETAKNKGRAIDERWHLHKNGTRFFMSGVMTPLPDSGVRGFVKVARNITDRKLVEEALFISEQRKSLAIKSAELGEWEWNLITDRIQFSREVSALIGVDFANAVVSPGSLMRLVVPEDQPAVNQSVAAAMSGLNILQIECRIRRPDNDELKWINIYGRVVKRQHEVASIMMGVVFDVTPRKLLEQQKDDFISLASHELKTPVTAIKSYTEILLEQFADSRADFELSLLSKLNGQVDRLTRLIKNVLDTSILSEGRISLHAEPLDLNELIKKNLDALRTASSQHSLIWKPGMVAVVHADPERVMQVITNFVGNAAKYSAAGTEIILSTRDDEDKLVLEVHDKGMGIPSQEQSSIFERYYRGMKTPGKSGFGLGLYICAEIIRRHGGSIGVSSVPGEGSTFYFSLPYS